MPVLRLRASPPSRRHIAKASQMTPAGIPYKPVGDLNLTSALRLSQSECHKGICLFGEAEQRASGSSPSEEATPAAHRNHLPIRSRPRFWARWRPDADPNDRQLLLDRAFRLVMRPEVHGHLTFAVPFGCMTPAPQFPFGIRAAVMKPTAGRRTRKPRKGSTGSAASRATSRRRPQQPGWRGRPSSA